MRDKERGGAENGLQVTGEMQTTLSASLSLWLMDAKQINTDARKTPIKGGAGTSLVVQWLRIRLPMQGTQVRALVREDPTCHGATKPVSHNH